MGIFKKKKKVEDLYTIEDLESARSKIKMISIKDKKNVRIVIIDDEGFDDDEETD